MLEQIDRRASALGWIPEDLRQWVIGLILTLGASIVAIAGQFLDPAIRQHLHFFQQKYYQSISEMELAIITIRWCSIILLMLIFTTLTLFLLRRKLRRSIQAGEYFYKVDGDWLYSLRSPAISTEGQRVLGRDVACVVGGFTIEGAAIVFGRAYYLATSLPKIGVQHNGKWYSLELNGEWRSLSFGGMKSGCLVHFHLRRVNPAYGPDVEGLLKLFAEKVQDKKSALKGTFYDLSAGRDPFFGEVYCVRSDFSKRPLSKLLAEKFLDLQSFD